MTRSDNLYALPEGLPVPEDDGACDHLPGRSPPSPHLRAGGDRFVKRITLIVRDGVIEKVFYPVFPPDGNVEEVAGWLGEKPASP